MKKTFFFFLFLVIAASHTQAQDYYFRHLQVENGLSHNTITSSIQDHRGFMWFGTKDGLNRFDGYNFKTFKNRSDFENSLGSNFIRTLHEYQNNIWVGTDNGLYRYNEEVEDFELVKATINKPILDIANDNNGNLWYIAAGVLYKLPVKGHASETEMTSFGLDYVEYLMQDKKGHIWVSSHDRLFKYSEGENLFTPIQLKYITSTDFPLIITALHPADSSTLLIGTKYHGALSYDYTTKELASLFSENESPLYVRDFAFRNKKELWMATESGLYIYNLSRHTYINLKKSYNNPYALSDNALYSLTVDKEGGVWIGTYFGGVNYYSKPFTPFNKYFPMVGENSISGNAVREIHKDKYGKLWIGTEDAGLNRFDVETKKFTRIPQKNLSYYNIHGILPIDNELWVGTFEHGLDVLDLKTGNRIRHYDTENSGLKSDFILDIFISKSNHLYILTSLGIYEYLKKDDHFVTVSGFPATHHYSYIEEDKNGTLWAGTYWDGLFYYDPSTGEHGVFTHKNDNEKSLSSNVINGIYRDSSNRLWITTENGLNLYNRETENFTRFTTKEGLASNVTYSILEDDHQNLWISTSAGIVKFDPETHETKTYTKANGLLSDQFNYSSAYKDEDGTMYFGSVYGMISFDPQSFSSNSYNAPILFTQMQINNKDVDVNGKDSPLDKSVNFIDEIELNHQQNSFSLEFANLTYTAPQMTEYWYRMKGLNDDWIYLGKEHKVYFTELSAGDYNLQVKSKNAHGSWNKQTANLAISVLPPIWLSKWAYLIYTFLILGFLWYLLRYYHRYNQNKTRRKFQALQVQQEKEIYQAKIQFFTNIAHEIRTPLTLIKAPLEKLLKTSIQQLEFRENVEIMERNTNRLLDLVNQLLDFRKTETKALKLTFVEVDIVKLLKDIKLRFKPAIEEKNIDFKVQCDTVSLPAFADKEALNKILSNLFNNAIKYGEKEVIVSLDHQDKDYYTIKIENDGEIIPDSLSHKIFEPFFRINENESRAGTGIGLSLAYSLAQLHNGELKLKKENHGFNTFVLKLPVHQEKEFQLHSSRELPNGKATQVIQEPNTSAERVSILVVEDSEELLDFLYREFQSNYKVFKAENGQKAIEVLREQNIQLVISDVSMPVMDGQLLCETIKTNLEFSHIPVILLTAKNALQSKIEGLESGADVYVTKPFSIEYLKAQAHTLILNRKNIMNYFASTPLSHIKSIANTKTDKDFLEKLEETIYTNMANTNLNVDVLADIMNMSRSTLYRKIKDLSSLSPNELINISRLKKAAELLATREYKIFEVAEKVGYKSQNSLGRNFQKQFNMTPTEYMSSSEKKLPHQ